MFLNGILYFQVKLIDEFFHPKKQQQSRTYRIVYRHMTRPLTKTEVNKLHTKIATKMIQYYDVELRWSPNYTINYIYIFKNGTIMEFVSKYDEMIRKARTTSG